MGELEIGNATRSRSMTFESRCRRGACHAVSVECGRSSDHPQQSHRTRTKPVRRGSRMKPRPASRTRRMGVRRRTTRSWSATPRHPPIWRALPRCADSWNGCGTCSLTFGSRPRTVPPSGRSVSDWMRCRSPLSWRSRGSKCSRLRIYSVDSSPAFGLKLVE
jgi:hypothetical protein